VQSEKFLSRFAGIEQKMCINDWTTENYEPYKTPTVRDEYFRVQRHVGSKSETKKIAFI
jgi:hypothetical protein